MHLSIAYFDIVRRSGTRGLNLCHGEGICMVLRINQASGDVVLMRRSSPTSSTHVLCQLPNPNRMTVHVR
jgi:hypothetical protein